MAAAMTSTVALDLDSARKGLDAARQALATARKAAESAAFATWVAAGGCPKCKGAGGFATSWHDGDNWWDACAARQDGTCSYGKMPVFFFRWEGPEAERLSEAVSAALARVGELESANEVGPGKLVRVYRGRKVPIGTVGRVFWRGESTFGRGRYAKVTVRIGLKDGAGTTWWTAADNVEVLEGPPADTRPESEKPARGRRIKHGDTVGIVFWYGRGKDGVGFRVGYNAVNGRKVSKDATWADAGEVELLAA